jgi:hypothetical protein
MGRGYGGAGQGQGKVVKWAERPEGFDASVYYSGSNP